MDQFEYVMVLVSIIVGLGIAHILLGVAGIIDRKSRKEKALELSLAHATWLGLCFAECDCSEASRGIGVCVAKFMAGSEASTPKGKTAPNEGGCR